MEVNNLINATGIKAEPLYKRMLCVHSYTGGIRNVYDKYGKKRHARICVKCGRRDYTG